MDITMFMGPKPTYEVWLQVLVTLCAKDQRILLDEAGLSHKWWQSGGPARLFLSQCPKDPRILEALYRRNIALAECVCPKCGREVATHRTKYHGPDIRAISFHADSSGEKCPGVNTLMCIAPQDIEPF